VKLVVELNDRVFNRLLKISRLTNVSVEELVRSIIERTVFKLTDEEVIAYLVLIKPEDRVMYETKKIKCSEFIKALKEHNLLNIAKAFLEHNEVSKLMNDDAYYEIEECWDYITFEQPQPEGGQPKRLDWII
jgi:hypothetical protein